jgi:hypothetical protein
VIDRGYEISRSAFDRLRRHADSARPGFEIGGKLVTEGDRVVDYRPMRNLAVEPGWFQPVEVPRPPIVLAHSHPGSRLTDLSRGDIAWMRSHFRPLAVFAPVSGSLTIYWLDTTRETGVCSFPVTLEPRPRARPRPSLRPGSRR